MFKRSLEILAYSNVWVAFNAVAICCSGYLFLGSELVFDRLLIICGIATWSVYLLIRLAAIKRIKSYEPTKRWRFFLEHLRLIYIITALGFLICAVLFFQLPLLVQKTLLLPAGISIIYGLPFSRKGRRLRDIGILKIFLISFVWASTGSLLPAANIGLPIFSPTVCLLFGAQFFFIFGNAISFDIKDLDIDVLHGVRTIPVRLGIDQSYSLAFLSLFVSAALIQWQQWEWNYANPLSVPAGASLLITGLVIFFAGKRKNELGYFFLLDGTILLQFLLLLVYNYRF